MPTETQSLLQGGHATSLSPAEIERELSAMWKPSSGDADPSTSRVVLANVIWIGGSQRLALVRPLLMQLLPKFPCRLFVLEIRTDGDPEQLSAAVDGQCFLRPGSAPVCCEVIHIAYGPAAARHIRGCVAPLLLGELRTVLLDGTSLEEQADTVAALEELADTTITRLTLSHHPAAGLKALAECARPAFELTWFRIAPLRDHTAAFFDEPHLTPLLQQIAAVRVVCRQTTENSLHPRVGAALYVGWLASRLGWTAKRGAGDDVEYASPTGPVRVSVCFDRAIPESSGTGLHSIELETRHGETFSMVLAEATHSTTLKCHGMTAADVQKRLFFSELDEVQALGVALNQPGPVRTFRSAAALAAPLLSGVAEEGHADVFADVVDSM